MEKRRDRMLLLAGLTVIFMGAFLLFGSRTYTDTGSYEVMSPIREPAYALFLRFFRSTFGERAYTIAAVVQNLLAIGCIYLLLTYIIEYNRITSWLVRLAVCVAVLLPYVITPLFSSTRLILANAMLTEGVTLSLYLLYFFFMLHLFWEKEISPKRYFFYSLAGLLTALLLTLNRGQMMLTMIAWLIAEVACLWRRHKVWLLVYLLMFIAAFGMRTLTVGLYNQVYNGTFAATPYGNVTLFTNLLYVAEPDSVESIEDETLRELYAQLYEQASEQQVLYSDAPDGFADEMEFFENAHDVLKMDIIEVTLGTYIEESYGDIGYLKKLICMDELAGQMMKAILPDCFGVWLLHYLKNVLVGLIRSVAVLHPLFYLPVLCGYLFLILTGLHLWEKKKDDNVVTMFAFVTLLTAGTVGGVSLAIMCLSRYMIYNTSLIYLCGNLMIWRLAGEKEKRKNGLQKSEI